MLEYRIGAVLLLHVSLYPRQGWVMSRRGNCIGHLYIGVTLFTMNVEEAFGSSEVGMLIYCLSGTSHWQVFPRCSLFQPHQGPLGSCCQCVHSAFF